MSKYFIGIDIGTSETKAIAINENAEIVAQASTSHGINILKNGWIEQDANKIYWDDFRKTVSQILKSVDNVNAIGISGLSPSLVPIDSNGEPVRDSIIYMDRRGDKEAKKLEEELGMNEVIKITGNAPSSFFGGYKLAWFINNEPENYKRTWKVLDASKYIVYKLTGMTVMDEVSASLFAPYFDMNKNSWSYEIDKVLGGGTEKLPEICRVGDVVGYVTNDAAGKTGLPEGTPVIAGSTDAAMAAYSSGVTNVGDSCLIYGSTGVWMTVTNIAKYDYRLINSKYLWGNTISGSVLTFGSLLKWFAENVLKKNVSILKDLDLEAENIPPGSEGIITLPYFMGERTPIWDPNIRGMIIGLSISHTRGSVYRSLLEGVSFGLRQSIDVAKEMGIKINVMKAIGGGAKSRIWRQIVSDVTGIRQEYVYPNYGAAFGTAFLAANAIGVFKDPAEIKNYVKIVDVNIPNESLMNIYSKIYSRYLKLYPTMKMILGD
jgi:xylulokinase